MEAPRTKNDAWRAGYARAQQQALRRIECYIEALESRAEYDSARYFLNSIADDIAGEEPWFTDVGLPFAAPARQPAKAA